MSTENLRLHIAHIFLTATLALTIAGCAEEDVSTNFQNDCTPLEWTEMLPENGGIRVGTLKFINSGGVVILAPNSRTQPTVVGGELRMTTNNGIEVTIAIDKGDITFVDGTSYYQISQNPKNLRTVEAVITQSCESNSQAITR